jgi:hypothetical protein
LLDLEISFSLIFAGVSAAILFATLNGLRRIKPFALGS